MVSFKNYTAWSHTSAIMAIILNVNKDTKKHGVTPFDAFNPYSKELKDPQKKKDISESEAKFNFYLMRKAIVDQAQEYKYLPKNTPKVKYYVFDKETGKEVEVTEDKFPKIKEPKNGK